MKDLSIADALRFAFSGIVLYLYLYILFPERATTFASTAGAVGFPLVLIVVGCGIYFIYQPLLYNPVIERLQDRFARTGSNYRTMLTKRYGIDSLQARRLFIQVRDTHLRKRYRTLDVFASGVHMTYQAGFLAIPMAVIGAWRGQMGQSILLLCIGVVTLTAGFVNDARYERIERDMIVVLGWEIVDEIARKLGYTVPTS